MKLVDILATAINTKPDIEAIKNALFQILVIQQDNEKIYDLILGIHEQYLNINSNNIEFVSGSDRVSISEICRALNVIEDLKRRLLLPHTEGTDEIYDLENFDKPVQQIDDTGIIGGSLFINNDDPRLTDNRNPIFYDTVGNITTNTTFGYRQPTNPANGHLWFEPDALAPQPWVWDANTSNWRSDVDVVDFPALAVSTGASLTKKFPDNTPAIWIRNSSAHLRTNGSGININTDYYTMNLRVFNISGVQTILNNFTNQGQQLVTSRFSDINHNLYVRNPAYIEMVITRFGTAPNITCTNSSTLNIRYVR